MADRPRPSYADMIDLPEDPVEAPKPAAAPVQAVEAEQPKPTAVAVAGPTQDRGGTALKGSAPTAYRPETKAKAETPKVAAPKPTKAKAAPSVLSRREHARLRREAPKPEPADYAQRSLYAREATFKLFRALAYENDVAAQQLYREGLFLVLQKYGKADGLSLDDM
ncbi:hypothetical protein [Methylobacterium sp. SI9]|uniref:hypothetical protein n=1 Tax=Methylobacterium guangdongense TaxID=3138811 RepID=UPI00313E417C